MDHLCFGSECGDISLLKQIAEILAHEPEYYKEKLKEKLRQGYAYPTARSFALLEYCPSLQTAIDIFASLLSPSDRLFPPDSRWKILQGRCLRRLTRFWNAHGKIAVPYIPMTFLFRYFISCFQRKRQDMTDMWTLLPSFPTASAKTSTSLAPSTASVSC